VEHVLVVLDLPDQELLAGDVDRRVLDDELVGPAGVRDEVGERSGRDRPVGRVVER